MKRRTIKRTTKFWLYRCRGRLFLRCLKPNSYPRTVRLADCYERQLQLAGGDFDGACVLELGCGLYSK